MSYFDHIIFGALQMVTSPRISVLLQVDSLEHHIVSYDLKDILMLKELHNTLHVEPWVRWGPSKFYFLKDLPRFLFPLSFNTKKIPTCIVQNMTSKVSIGSMIWYSTEWLSNFVTMLFLNIMRFVLVSKEESPSPSLFWMRLLSCLVMSSMPSRISARFLRAKVSPVCKSKMFLWLPSSCMLLWLFWMKLASCLMIHLAIFFVVLPSAVIKPSRQSSNIF